MNWCISIESGVYYKIMHSSATRRISVCYYIVGELVKIESLFLSICIQDMYLYLQSENTVLKKSVFVEES